MWRLYECSQQQYRNRSSDFFQDAVKTQKESVPQLANIFWQYFYGLTLSTSFNNENKSAGGALEVGCNLQDTALLSPPCVAN